ncbi:hypothetical protein LXL04_013205 [Taraxacum kok-saghyz]
MDLQFNGHLLASHPIVAAQFVQPTVAPSTLKVIHTATVASTSTNWGKQCCFSDLEIIISVNGGKMKLASCCNEVAAELIVKVNRVDHLHATTNCTGWLRKGQRYAIWPSLPLANMVEWQKAAAKFIGLATPMMADWSDNESDFTEQIAMMAMMGMQRVVEILEESEEEEGVVNSQPMTRQPIPRDRVGAHNRLIAHYFAPNCDYPPSVFRRRFRMHKPLFLRILNDVTANSNYMQQRSDATGSRGFSELQKCAVAIRQLAYGSVSDSWDEYFQISARTALESLDEFCSCIIELYWGRYMRKPTPTDVQALYAHHSQHHGLPANHGQFTQGHRKHATMILEAVASQDLWFWHCYFGPAGSNNDLNVLQMSPIFNHILNGTAPDTSFQLWAVFVKTIAFPDNEVTAKFKRAQERARKDIERAFGALKKRWGILQRGAQSTDRDKVARIMYACCILHNMILEDEGKAVCAYVAEENVVPNPPPIQPGSPESLAIRRALRNRPIHFRHRESLGLHLQTVDHVDLNEIPQDDAEEFSN